MIIKKLGDCREELPVGLLATKNGTTTNHRSFELGPLTGRVRIAMGAKELKDNPAARSTKLLSFVVRRIGDIERPGESLIRSLTSVDREHLLWLVDLRRAAVKSVEDSLPCECGETTDVELSLDDLLVNVLEDGDARVEGGERLFDFTDPQGRTLVARLVRGEDEERVAPFYVKNPDEADMRGLHAAIVSWEGEKLSWEKFLDLDVDSLEWITSAMNSVDVGTTQRVRTACWSCGRELVKTISPFDFLETSSGKGIKVSPPYETRSSA